jgi:serine/threonine-protein kinase
MINEKYRVIRPLGMGGMGAVYLAENVGIGRQVAIKVLRPEFANDVQVVTRFKQEARAAAAIGHPGIVEVLDLGSFPDGGLFIVMEALEGETLRDHLKRMGTLPPGQAAGLLADVLDTLAAAHDKGVIHRDLKPDNIFLLSRPAGAAKILDFGISKFRNDDVGLTQAGVVMGTPLYMSPEQAKGSKDVTPSADVYSAGAILYEALSGQPPFAGESYNEVLIKVVTETQRPLTQLRADVPPALATLIDAMLSKVPAWRPPDARAAAFALRQAVGLGTAAKTTPAHPAVLQLAQTPGAGVDATQIRTEGPFASPALSPPPGPAVTSAPSLPPPVATQPRFDPYPLPAPHAAGPAVRPPMNRARLVGAGVAAVVVLLASVGAFLGASQGKHDRKHGKDDPKGQEPSVDPKHGPHDRVETTGIAGPRVGTPQGTTGGAAVPAPVPVPVPIPSPPPRCGDSACALYAATDHELRTLDPADPSRVERTCRFGGALDDRSLVADIALDSQGVLYALTGTDLFRVDPATCAAVRLTSVAQPRVPFNALTWTPSGLLLGADATGAVRSIDPRTGAVNEAGQFGSKLGCSGDLVARGDGALFATAHALGAPATAPDVLVKLDPITKEAQRVGILDAPGVYGLAFQSGALIGFDQTGRTLRIDPDTAEVKVLGTQPGLVFYGGASLPQAR